MDDIGFLKAKSTKDSYLFFVDSGTRDFNRYPEPNHYSIRFNTPFKNVYSLEVIDASIPRTQFSIETYNNILNYTVNGITKSVMFDIGDYSDDLLIIEMNSKLQNDDITVENLSTPGTIRNTFVFKSPFHFSLNMNESTIYETLGFHAKGVHTSVPNPKYYTSQTILDDFSDDSYNVYFKNNNHLMQKFNSSVSGNLQKIDVRIGCNVNMTLLCVIQKYVLIDDDNYDYVTISNQVSLNINGNDIDSLATSIITISGFKDINGIDELYIDNGVQYYVRMSFTNNIDDFIIYIDVHLISDGREELYSAVNSTNLIFAPITNMIVYNTSSNNYGEFNVWSIAGVLHSAIFNTMNADDIMLSLDAQIYVNTTIETIIAPGIYSLIGERYIILRCPEIEDHMFRSRAFEKYNMGLAKFNLSILGYGQERFDYNSLPPRSFHPIGKLDMLSFRFERPNGQLYNFRGANHTITFLLKYYTPYQKEINTYSKLNPEYNPDYLEYIQNQKSDTDDSSDDEVNNYELQKSMFTLK